GHEQERGDPGRSSLEGKRRGAHLGSIDHLKIISKTLPSAAGRQSRPSAQSGLRPEPLSRRVFEMYSSYNPPQKSFLPHPVASVKAGLGKLPVRNRGLRSGSHGVEMGHAPCTSERTVAMASRASIRPLLAALLLALPLSARPADRPAFWRPGREN